MADEQHIAQHLIEKWLLSKGYSTSRTVDGRAIAIHCLKYTGFAKLYLSDSTPIIWLHVFDKKEFKRRLRDGMLHDKWSAYYPGDERFITYEISLGESTCFDNIASLLERAIFDFIDLEHSPYI